MGPLPQRHGAGRLYGCHYAGERHLWGLRLSPGRCPGESPDGVHPWGLGAGGFPFTVCPGGGGWPSGDLCPVLARLSGIFEASAAVFHPLGYPASQYDGAADPGGGAAGPELPAGRPGAGHSSGGGPAGPEPHLHRPVLPVYGRIPADPGLRDPSSLAADR